MNDTARADAYSPAKTLTGDCSGLYIDVDGQRIQCDEAFVCEECNALNKAERPECTGSFCTYGRYCRYCGVRYGLETKQGRAERIRTEGNSRSISPNNGRAPATLCGCLSLAIQVIEGLQNDYNPLCAGQIMDAKNALIDALHANEYEEAEMRLAGFPTTGSEKR